METLVLIGVAIAILILMVAIDQNRKRIKKLEGDVKKNG